MTDSNDSRARLVGINHVALEVGDIDAALDFYGSLFEFDLRSRSESAAFIDMGDQFLALSAVDDPGGSDDPDDHRQSGALTSLRSLRSRRHRHFGLVVDDAEVVERRLAERDVERLSTRGLEFRDPWGNRVQVVAYEDIQFTKADHILRGMGLSDLEKTDSALDELAEKGLAPE